MGGEFVKLEFKEIKVKRIPHVIVGHIRKQMIEGNLQPGDHLPTELELAQRFNVGRSSIREALQILEGLGLVERRKREGTIVRQITAEDLAKIYIPKPEDEILVDLMETRELLELSIVDLVVKRASEEEIEELEISIKRMEEDPENIAKYDVLFHITMGRISHNQVVANIIQSLKQTMDKLQDKILDPERANHVIIEHKRIVEAIKERDEVKARECLKQHLQNAKKGLEDFKNRQKAKKNDNKK